MSVWSDLPGQSAVIEQLSRAAAAERPAHAWLFTGPPGSGRSNAAKAFAAALLCEQQDPAERGCGTCHACRTVLAGSNADATLVATENVTFSIQEMRELVGKAQDKPSSGRWRVIIIEDADRMTERTTNVLLKAIEEPPPRTIWMLCTPSPADVLVTIRSRCRPVSLRIPPADDVAALLVRRDGADPELAGFAARVSQSHIGVARRLAADADARHRRDTIVRLPLRLRGVADAVTAAGELVDISNADAAAASEQRNESEREALLIALGAPEKGAMPPAIRSQLKRLEEDQKRRAKRSLSDSLDRVLIDLSTFFRDVLTVQLGTGTELVNEYLRQDLTSYAERSTPEQTLGRMDAIAQARQRLGTNVAPVLAMEAMAVSLL
ncbi:DNA polymerase III subunit delta' [Arthrobacter sulfonylureivorans]|uniref:DNA polymerase III subunit delta n=1 Tax=Arthrobacter sulfonylureivorans TaxID=2486855 RepID=A0ABY3WA31_9MICC|nr:DNA polymerase III subunit delta' [Arthrobacter sulfonylureivorans]UNK45428.1 DNA polymerase III subunit delta' [Arthrobacter sulfonylureivorans]